MPATWGYGYAGIEPGTMSGWGYPGNVDVHEGIFSAQEKKTSYRAREIESSYSATEKKTSYRGNSDEE